MRESLQLVEAEIQSKIEQLSLGLDIISKVCFFGIEYSLS
jgi:hypothetical protein